MNRSRHLVGLVVLTAALAFPLGVLANHTFTDVSTSSTFHPDISAIAEAGVTTGCAVGKYCPKDFVTREQMAAFINRLGALGAGKTPVVNAATAQTADHATTADTADNADDAGLLDGLDSDQFVRSDVAVGGQTSCIGAQMTPEFGSMDWGVDGWLIYPTANDNWFICQLHFPDGATISSFRGHFRDNSMTEGARCELFRSNWTNGTSLSLAAPDPTSDAGTAAYIVKETTDILEPLVDNTTYTYWAECGAFALGGSVGIFGVTAPYTVTGSPEE